MRAFLDLLVIVLAVAGLIYVIAIVNIYRFTGELHWNVFAQPQVLSRVGPVYLFTVVLVLAFGRHRSRRRRG